LRIIDDQSRRMNAVVENVLQLSRRDHVKPVRLRLNDWLPAFAAQFAETVGHAGNMITVQTAGEVTACVDTDQLHQIVSNLCTNAMKNSPPFEGKAVIALRTGVDAQHHPFIDCIDWGSGIATEIIDRIFDPFFTTSSKGTGLGLYIARELCEANGALIDYHPNQPIGARFRVTLARPEECVV
jgi:two-component system sensor histidine kinase PilS (NtrC family)